MATTMRRAIRGMVALATIVAIAWSVVGGGQIAEAGTGYEQWTGPDANGCYTYWDGYSYTTAACARGDGSFDFYVPSNGQWGYAYTAGYDANGCYFFWDGFQYTVYTCPASAVQQQGQPGTGSTTIGGDSLTIGGDALPAGGSWTPTGNALIDSIMIDSIFEENNVWLQPTCIEIVGDICYD